MLKMEENKDQDLRMLPSNELDLNLMLTDSVWGSRDVSPELRERLSRYIQIKDEDGNPVKNEAGQFLVSKSSLWGLLGFYTRDLRLSNLSQWDNTYTYVTYYLDLANDYLQCNMIEPFLICLSRSATQLECSQSKNGFLRKNMNTLRREDSFSEMPIQKKGFFGGKTIEGKQ